MRGVVVVLKVLVLLCALAYIAGMQRARDAQPPQPVPTNSIAPWWCSADGGVRRVRQDRTTGVLHATCRDGVVVLAVGR
jgi:hypothetical protein